MYKAVALFLALGPAAAWAQTQSTPAAGGDKASAYYHYTLAHMYAELAGAYGNRGDYVNQAIENYKAAIQADPGTPMLSEELSDLYVQSGRLREAQTDAEDALKKNPNDLNALRLLARVYTSQIGDSQQNRIDEAMLKKSIEQYQKLTALDPKDIDSWLMLGRLQKVAENSVDAEQAYQKVLAIEPANQDAMTGLAMLYSDRGDNQKAAQLLQQLAAKDPSPRSLQALAGVYEQMHEFPLAAEALGRALELNPPNEGDIQRAMAQDLMLAEKYDDALKVYQELVEDDPTDAQSFLRMSQVYRQKHDFTKAREMADKAKTLDPSNLEIRYNEVSILQAENKTPQAIQLMSDILTSTAKRTYSQGEKSNRVQLLERLAGLQRSVDQTDPAVDTYRQMIELDSELAPRLEAEIIDTYRTGREFKKAQDEADSAVKKYSDEHSVRVARDILLADLGKTDEAAADVKKMLGGKNDRDTYLSLAQVYDKGRKFEDMSKAIDAAEKLSENNDDKEGVWFMRGAMYEREKKTELAEAEFKKVLGVNPDSSATLNYLGYMLADRNVRLPEALKLVQDALDKDPGNGAYLDSLGWVYFRMGRLPEAEENIRLALDKTPHDPTVHDHLGDVLARESKLKEAVAQWQASLNEYQSSSPADADPAEISKVRTKLESAKVRLAKESGPAAR